MKESKGTVQQKIGVISEAYAAVSAYEKLVNKGFEVVSSITNTEEVDGKIDCELTKFAAEQGVFLGQVIVNDILTYMLKNNISGDGCKFEITETGYEGVYDLETDDIKVILTKDGALVKEFALSLKMKTTSGDILAGSDSTDAHKFMSIILKDTDVLETMPEVVDMYDDKFIKEGLKLVHEEFKSKGLSTLDSKKAKELDSRLGFNTRDKASNNLGKALEYILARVDSETTNKIVNNFLYLAGYKPNVDLGLILKRKNSSAVTFYTSINCDIYKKILKSDSIVVKYQKSGRFYVEINKLKMTFNYNNKNSICPWTNPYKAFNL